jgi:hypothetical protein
LTPLEHPCRPKVKTSHTKKCQKRTNERRKQRNDDEMAALADDVVGGGEQAEEDPCDVDQGLMEGWLHKKSPAGMTGFRVWQKRWFSVFNRRSKNVYRVFAYCKKQSQIASPINTIPLERITRVRRSSHACMHACMLCSVRVYYLLFALCLHGVRL